MTTPPIPFRRADDVRELGGATMPIRIAIVGLGKIAHDQHLPAIAQDARFELVAAATHAGTAETMPVFPTLDALLASDIQVDAISMCQPPQSRFEDTVTAINAGKHVLLEKPPAATLAEVETLVARAEAAGTTLFAAWHSRFAPGVEPARAWLADRRVETVEIVWKEDVRRWHPGQTWIWQPGGMGVFDPGINALSIATAILAERLVLREGTLHTPANCAAPIAADLTFAGVGTGVGGCRVHAAFDFRQTGPQTWDITVATNDGTLVLSSGGAKLAIDGVVRDVGSSAEYPAMYTRFAELIARRQSDVDPAPLTLVADAFMRCRVEEAAAFVE